MNSAEATILAAVLGVGVIMAGGLLKLSGRLSAVEQALSDLRDRVVRGERKDDYRDQRNEGRRRNGGE